MSPSSSLDPNEPLAKMSLHVLISASSPHHDLTPPPVPTIFLHNQLRTQAPLAPMDTPLQGTTPSFCLAGIHSLMAPLDSLLVLYIIPFHL
jgi:hypothetical protein